MISDHCRQTPVGFVCFGFYFFRNCEQPFSLRSRVHIERVQIRPATFHLRLCVHALHSLVLVANFRPIRTEVGGGAKAQRPEDKSKTFQIARTTLHTRTASGTKQRLLRTLCSALHVLIQSFSSSSSCYSAPLWWQLTVTG